MDCKAADFVVSMAGHNKVHVDAKPVHIKRMEILRTHWAQPRLLPKPRFPNAKEWSHIRRGLKHFNLMHKLISFQAVVRGAQARSLLPDYMQKRKTIAIRIQYLWRRKVTLRKLHKAVKMHNLKLMAKYFAAIHEFSEMMMKEEEGQKRRYSAMWRVAARGPLQCSLCERSVCVIVLVLSPTMHSRTQHGKTALLEGTEAWHHQGVEGVAADPSR